MHQRNALSPQAMTLFGLLSVVVTAFIAWIAVLALRLPLPAAIAVACLLLCLDAASIAMVWYATGRHSQAPDMHG